MRCCRALSKACRDTYLIGVTAATVRPDEQTAAIGVTWCRPDLKGWIAGARCIQRKLPPVNRGTSIFFLARILKAEDLAKLAILWLDCWRRRDASANSVQTGLLFGDRRHRIRLGIWPEETNRLSE
jgi:hypothetical protein